MPPRLPSSSLLPCAAALRRVRSRGAGPGHGAGTSDTTNPVVPIRVPGAARHCTPGASQTEASGTPQTGISAAVRHGYPGASRSCTQAPRDTVDQETYTG